MAGPQMLHAEFAGPLPSWAEVIDKAEEIGGMALMFEPLPKDPEMAASAGELGADVRGNIFFAVWPELGNVQVDRGVDSREIGVADYSQISSTLVALLQHAFVALGGTVRGGALLPLDAPLTPEKLRREQAELRRLALRATAMVVGSLVALVVFVVLLAWAGWTGVRALAG